MFKTGTDLEYNYEFGKMFVLGDSESKAFFRLEQLPKPSRWREDYLFLKSVILRLYFFMSS